MLPRPSYWVFMIIFTSVLTAVVCITYTGWSQRRSDRKFCEVVGVSVQAYRQAPPSTETGRRIQQAQERLYTDLECGK